MGGNSDGSTTDNALFVIPPAQVTDLLAGIGPLNDDLERVAAFEQVIFWSANRAQINKTRWARVAGTKVSDMVTIRNANTARRLISLADCLSV